MCGLFRLALMEAELSQPLMNKTVRIWNVSTHKQIGEALRGHPSTVICVSESADGCHIVSRDDRGSTIVWNHEKRAIVWKSAHEEDGSANNISDDEAEWSSAAAASRLPILWPDSFPPYTAELYCDGECAYSNVEGEITLMADNLRGNWTYNAEGKLLAAGLPSGAVAICKLITK